MIEVGGPRLQASGASLRLPQARKLPAILSVRFEPCRSFSSERKWIRSVPKRSIESFGSPNNCNSRFLN